MIERVHGIDRHKLFSTISVLDRQGQEVEFIGACRELGKYVEGLGASDAVIVEASTGAFWWADQIEARGARCSVVDPYKFRIIKDSWNKTDKQDARNLAKALWVHVVTGEFGIPEVYKPPTVVRELRKLFAQHCLLNRQITTHKNNAQAIFVENGVELKKGLKRRLFAPESGPRDAERDERLGGEPCVSGGEPAGTMEGRGSEGAVGYGDPARRRTAEEPGGASDQHQGGHSLDRARLLG